MGFLGDMFDDIVDLPGKVIDGVGDAAEKVVKNSIELPVKVVKGTVDGVKGAADKIDETLDL